MCTKNFLQSLKSLIFQTHITHVILNFLIYIFNLTKYTFNMQIKVIRYCSVKTIFQKAFSPCHEIIK